MIGGFLGAGKTTAAARLARYLIGRGLRIGMITNDQSTGLVDTALLRWQGFPVQEITGGCFCCRFDSLLEAARRLATEGRPDVYLAEPVGSCTDLVATVSYPLRRIHGDRFTIAPLSVLVDPTRAARILGLQQGGSFSAKVVYVYRKQLEEADVIVINKCDLLAASMRRRLVDRVRGEFPRAEVFCCSAGRGTGLEDWFERILSGQCPDGPTMELDYDRYAEGEALLGWLNCTVRLSAAERFDGDALLLELAEQFRGRLAAEGAEIAHLKMTLESGDQEGSVSAVSLVGGDATADVRSSLLGLVKAGSCADMALIINLRAEADPEILRRVTNEVLREPARSGGELMMELEHLECFRPARPAPTHRVTVPA